MQKAAGYQERMGQPASYRPDIDGLRAVSILLVVGYHAHPWLLPGGFVGVDVFFVI
jgi:peptidoglycan/LPS O-acetylase OafA/YrhL